MIRSLIIVCFCLLSMPVFSQQMATISGVLQDQQSGEAIRYGQVSGEAETVAVATPLHSQHSMIEKGKVLLGASVGSNGFSAIDRVTREESYAVSVVMQPRIGVLLTDRILLAVQGEIQITRSSLPNPWLNDEYYGIGGLGRYYFYVLPQVKPFSNEEVLNIFRGFVEIGAYAKNGDIHVDSLVSLPGLPIAELQLGVGFNLQLLKSLCLEFSLFYVNRPAARYEVAFPLTPRLGLEFFIPYQP